MLHLLGALAEFERALIHERQAEGIAVAKKQGRYRGRKPALSEGQLARARRLVAEGVPKTKVAAQLGVGRHLVSGTAIMNGPWASVWVLPLAWPWALAWVSVPRSRSPWPWR